MTNPKNDNTPIHERDEVVGIVLDKFTGELLALSDLRKTLNKLPDGVVRFRTPYNYHVRIQQKFDHNKARTKQEFVAQCDVNNIWNQFIKTGRTDQLMKARGMYVDISDGPQSYQESLNLVISAGDAFAQLPSDIREYYRNDVSLFMKDAVEDPASLFDRLEATKPGQPIPATAPPKTQLVPPEPNPEPIADPSKP